MEIVIGDWDVPSHQSPITKSMKQINWGIVGPGHIAGKFAGDLALVPDARLHAVASRSLERAKNFTEKFGGSHAFGSYAEMTDCPDLDAVYIASPHSGHFEHALLFLEKGIPVLCEKPLAINSRQVKKMVETARRNKVFLMEAIWTRFLPSFLKTIELIENQSIGKIKTVRADFGFSRPFDAAHRLFNISLGGGSLLDVGIYPVFFALQVLGRPEHIKALADFSPTGSDNSCGMIFHFPEGRMAMLDSSVTAQTRTDAFIYGEKGYLHLHPRFHESDRVTLQIHGEAPQHFDTPKTGVGYFHEIVEVGECLRSKKTESEKLPLDFSLKLMETLDRVRAEIGLIYPQDKI